MTAPGRPNSPEHDIERLRERVVMRESQVAEFQSYLDRERQRLAEALCPFKVGDRLRTKGDGSIITVEEISPPGEGDGHTSWRAVCITDNGYHAELCEGWEHVFEVLTPPSPFEAPALEAVMMVEDVYKAGRAGARIDARKLTREIIAALDAARAERRAEAQERRVQAMRQEIRRMLDALHAGAWMDVPKLADDFLAAADAAESPDAR